jgi:O-antigen ligase
VSNSRVAERRLLVGRLFAALFGVFLGVALLKFGTPAVMDKFVESPGKGIEWLVFVWPLRLAYPMVGLLALAGLFTIQWRRSTPGWLMIMPLVWLLWQAVSATQSVEARLSHATLAHFAVCVVCFYLGAFCINGDRARSCLLWPLAASLVIMVFVGFGQHFGGLEETRKYFWAEVYPTLPNVPPEYIKKMHSNRIFSTVFYPNAFAGALLLLLPPMLAWVWQARARFTAGARGLLCGLVGLSSAACLYWSGSKGGWLLALAVSIVALWHQDISRRLKMYLVCGLVVCGVAGFYWKNRAYMERGATSVVARLDYWSAAWQTAVARPVFGSGPGTFANAYLAVKKPESEMARLTHNDYLQQASDSGFPGLISYVVFIGGMLWVSYRRLDWKHSPVICGVWLGVLAWAAQSSFEFTLYVPSLAWTAFGLMGCLLGNLPETIRQEPSAAPNL